MKASELAEILLKNPDNEVKLCGRVGYADVMSCECTNSHFTRIWLKIDDSPVEIRRLGKFTIEQLLQKYAFKNFISIDELANRAKEEGVLDAKQPLKAIVPLLEEWMKDNPNNFYAELFFRGRLFLRARDYKKIGLIRYKIGSDND